MIHPSTELKFISEEIGYGVVAKEFIPKGTITWVLDELDREFTQEQVDAMSDIYRKVLDHYTYRNNRGNHVLCWDHARYVNHSFNSNCLSTAYDFEIAIRDIHPGEQLTDDYGYLNITSPFRGIDEGTKRKVVYPDDLTRYYMKWDQSILKTLPHIFKVQQALSNILPAPVWSTLENIVQGREEMLSILTCYYPDEKAMKSRLPSKLRKVS